jgi:23S rRNA pseudouridine1911/1915/1917 synthase
MQKFTVPETLHEARIDVALVELMNPYSRSFVQKLIRRELVLINKEIAKKGNRVSAGDKIIIREIRLEESDFKPTEIPLEVLYEDDDLLIINKPPGLLTHPSAHEREITLVNALLHHCGDRLSGIGGEKRPGIVHRLDRDTSGIMMVAKHDESHKDLAKQIQQRKVEKHYLALVDGIMKSDTGSIDAPLIKTQINGKNKVVVSPGRQAKDSLTHFKVQETFLDRYSLLQVQIITGRMHQIRVHLAAIGRPVIGDQLYGNKKANSYFENLGLTRQFLHAFRLKFQHPRTHEMLEFEAPLTDDLNQVLEKISSSVE